MMNSKTGLEAHTAFGPSSVSVLKCMKTLQFVLHSYKGLRERPP